MCCVLTQAGGFRTLAIVQISTAPGRARATGGVWSGVWAGRRRLLRSLRRMRRLVSDSTFLRSGVGGVVVLLCGTWVWFDAGAQEEHENGSACRGTGRAGFKAAGT